MARSTISGYHVRLMVFHLTSSTDTSSASPGKLSYSAMMVRFRRSSSPAHAAYTLQVVDLNNGHRVVAPAILARSWSCMDLTCSFIILVVQLPPVLLCSIQSINDILLPTTGLRLAAWPTIMSDRRTVVVPLVIRSHFDLLPTF